MSINALHRVRLGCVGLEAAAAGLTGRSHPYLDHLREIGTDGIDPAIRAGAQGFQQLAQLWEHPACEADKALVRDIEDFPALLVIFLRQGPSSILARFSSSAVSNLADSTHLEFSSKVVAAGAIAPLSTLVNDGEPAGIATDAAMALAALMHTADTRDAGRGAIAPLAKLLTARCTESDRPLEAAAMAALALQNLASGETASAGVAHMKDAILAAGVVPSLIEMLEPAAAASVLSDADAEGTDEEDTDLPHLRAAGALSALTAWHEPSQLAVRDAGGIRAIIQLLRADNSDADNSDAGNLARRGKRKVEERDDRSSLGNAKAPTVATISAMVDCLQSLSDCSPEVSSQIADDGAIPLLVPLLRDPSAPPFTSALKLMANLSISEKAALTILGSGAIASVVSLLESTPCPTTALVILSNLAANKVRPQTVVTRLVSLLDDPENSHCVATVATALANLACTLPACMAIENAGGIPKLEALAQSAGPAAEAASTALGNIEETRAGNDTSVTVRGVA